MENASLVPLPATVWLAALRGAGFPLMMVLDTTLG